jgi:hypothetical protein
MSNDDGEKTKNEWGAKMPTEQTLVESPLRDNGTNKVECKSEKMLLTTENIDRFVILKNRRDIRSGVKTKLRRLLEKGKHFDTPLVTNRITADEKDRLLDGNHRIECIKEFFEVYPNRKVEVYVMYYEDLDPAEEKKKYTQWNSGTKQNTNDFIKQYWDDIPMAKKMQRDFPCKVSYKWAVDTMEFKTLVSEYLVREASTFAGGYSGSAINFIDEVKLLGNPDYAVLRAFMIDFIEIFGKPDFKSNPHYKQANFYSIFRIWWDNKTRLSPLEVKKGFLKIKGNQSIQFFAKGGGTRENCQLCHTQLLRDINSGRTVNSFT